MRRRIGIAAAAAAAALTLGAAPAFGAHSSVRNPSGCHETNGNARTGAAASGNTSWTASAGGSATAAANSPVMSPEGC
jgi:hypothetical protein